MRRVTGRTPDGREIIYYVGTGAIAPGGAPAPSVRSGAAAPGQRERRWDAESGEWVLYATDRQARPVSAATSGSACPFCPGAASDGAWHEVDRDDFRLAVFPNRFPPLGASDGAPAAAGARRPSPGAAEVVLYTPRHSAALGDLDDGHVADLVRVWADRTRTLLGRPGVRYVLVFENRGPEVGATLAHPHGQVYAMAFVPPRLRALALRERAARRRDGACPFCRLLAAEGADGERLVDAEGGLVAYVPFAARMPYQLTLAPERCVDRLDALSAAEVTALGRLLARTVRRYDGLFGVPMPYMMAVVQGGRPGALAPGHLRLAFHPVRRSAAALKRLATSEALGGAYLVDLLPEAMAARLRAVRP